MFFGSTAIALPPVSPSASLMIFAIVLAVDHEADGSSTTSVKRPLSMKWAGRSASITAPPETRPTVGVLGSSIESGPCASAKMPLPGVGPCIGVTNKRPPFKLEAAPRLVT